MDQNILNNGQACLKYATKEKGIGEIDVAYEKIESENVSVRHGKFEKLDSSISEKFGVRVIHNKRQAIIAKTRLSDYKQDIDLLVDISKNLPEDQYLSLPSNNDLVVNQSFNLAKLEKPTEGELLNMALDMEGGARDGGAHDVEVASVTYTKRTYAFCASNGSSGEFAKSYISFFIAAVAKNDSGMEQGGRYKAFCQNPSGFREIGMDAAKKAVAKLGARKIATSRMPIIIDRLAAEEFLGHIIEALNGHTIAAGTSMFRDKVNQKCFNDCVTILDDPSAKDKLRSIPFDAEGGKPEPVFLVKHGHVRNYLLDNYTSKKLKLVNNKRAARSAATAPTPGCTNVTLQPTDKKLQDAISSISYGLYITDFIGMGVNLLTGDYSRGCSGFIIENGQVSYPVSEVTVSCNLMDVFSEMVPLDDLYVEFGVDSPSIYIPQVTIGGM